LEKKKKKSKIERMVMNGTNNGETLQRREKRKHQRKKGNIYKLKKIQKSRENYNRKDELKIRRRRMQMRDTG